jgi:MYXO-CTERM domain-containing protein
MGQGGDPSSAASGSKIWGNDLGEDGWNGEYQNEKHTRLESREYNTYHYQDAFLNYSRWLTIEDGYYDQASILADGDVVWTNWGTDQNRGTDHHIDNSWTSHSVELFGQADDGKLTLAFDLISDGGLTFGGWNIDDVCIFAPATADNRLGISDFTATLADDRGAVALSWTYPKHAPVERVRLVRKFGSFPTGPEDGDTIWEATGIELGAQAEIIDSLDPGELISHYAVYPSDGEAWLSWTLEGYNADAPDGAPSTPPGSDGNSVGTDNGGEGEKAGCGCASSQRALGPWMLLLGLVGLRRRRANA